MASGLIKPKKLKQGDTIGVMNPSSWAEPSYIEKNVDALRGHGYNVVVHPQCYERDHGAAGTTQQKIDALHEMFSDPSIDAIFALRGGSRALHMLDGIDYSLISRHPKIFIGFSDITVLLSAFYNKANIATFHGLTAANYADQGGEESVAHTLGFLGGNWIKPLWPDKHAETVRQGDASGVLFGGNLALLMALAASGENYWPDMAGKILIIEDVGEESRAIDRMLGTLRLRGVLDQIAGLVVGYMTDVRDTSYIRFDRSVAEIVMEHTAQMKGPVVLNAPIGHEHQNIPFPIGIRARLTAETNGGAQLQLMESPFADA
jgi:muramoyltetrapeptide carboxypeptidase